MTPRRSSRTTLAPADEARVLEAEDRLDAAWAAAQSVVVEVRRLTEVIDVEVEDLGEVEVEQTLLRLQEGVAQVAGAGARRSA